METNNNLSDMRKYGLLLLLIVISCVVCSQDIIFLQSGEQKEVIVKKVGVSTIEYVRFDNQGGAMYEVLKSEVHKIRYQNGVEEVINPVKKTEIAGHPEESKFEQFIDDRDSTLYKTVVIGDQTWLAENLKYKYMESRCNMISKDKCDECGRYYTFDEALQACPSGWHLPSDKEWMDLEIHFGMRESEAANTGWRGTHPGQAPYLMREGKSGLDLFMCGYASCYVDPYTMIHTYHQRFLLEEGFYWTSSAKNSTGYYRHFVNRASIDRDRFNKLNRLPIRCVKD